ncbi:MAG: DUF3276 family protein [Bacteroidota bacterium]|jgi:hypothetical protein
MSINALYSRIIRAGKTTYFLDVREAKNGKKFLSITSSSLNGEQRKRSNILVFADTVEQFHQAIQEAAAAAGQ